MRPVANGAGTARDKLGRAEFGQQASVQCKLLSCPCLRWDMYGRRPRCKKKESDLSAKRSGAAMYPAFECSRCGCSPGCDPLIGPKQKHAFLSSRGTQRVFPIDGLDRFASTSSSPLQFVNAPTQPHPPVAKSFLTPPQAVAPGSALHWPKTPRRCGPSCWQAQWPRP
jgi:hypothetical protein